MTRLLVLADAAAVAREAAVFVARSAAEAVAARGSFSLALSGGRTPRELYALLAGEWSARIPWERTGIWFADERAVPPDDPESNFRLVKEALLDPLGGRAPRVHALSGIPEELAATAARYAAELPDCLDLVILGIGEDGHVASLFPGSPLLGEVTRRVSVVRASPKPPALRLTLAPPALAAAREVLVLATGAAKAGAVALALAPDANPLAVPAALVRERDWLVDRAAASKLPAA